MSSRNVKRQRLNDSNDAGNSHCVCQPILSEQIMAFIKNENKTLLDKFERLLDEKFSYRPLWIKNTSTSLLPSFPINSVDKFDKFNKKLKTNKDVRKQFVRILKISAAFGSEIGKPSRVSRYRYFCSIYI